ncbi:MAG: histidine triad nucleotide-binding protein [Chlamydiota bacterium]
MTTIFTKIISGEIPSEKVFENEKIIAIKDIHPKAPIHILIIPKKPIHDLQSLQKEDFHLLGEIVTAAQEIAKKFHVENGYRLVTNNGLKAGQTIFHLHFHFLAGDKMRDLP